MESLQHNNITLYRTTAHDITTLVADWSIPTFDYGDYMYNSMMHCSGRSMRCLPGPGLPAGASGLINRGPLATGGAFSEVAVVSSFFSGLPSPWWSLAVHGAVW